MPMPTNVQFIFIAINDEGKGVLRREGFSDDYTRDLERFQEEVSAVFPTAVRIVCDIALPNMAVWEPPKLPDNVIRFIPRG